jgi:hypothetical protein
MNPLTKRDLKKLNRFEQVRFLLYLIGRHTSFPALPAPVHFSLVASLTMFVLLPLMPLHPLAIPIVIGGGISFALLLQRGVLKWLKSSF